MTDVCVTLKAVLQTSPFQCISRDNVGYFLGHFSSAAEAESVSDGK